MTARYSRYGVRIPDADVHAAEDGTVVIQADDSPVMRWRTELVKRAPAACCCGTWLPQCSPPTACCCGVTS